MTNKQFVVYAHKNDFDDDLSTGVINQYQIVFIEDTKQIWTQNTFYSCPFTKEEIMEYIYGLKDGKVDKVEGKDLISVELIQKLEEINTEEIQNNIDGVDSKVQSVKEDLYSATVNGKLIIGNPVLTKEDIGLNNVDNTSDLDKPISTATQSALDNKANISDLSNVLAEDVADVEIEDITPTIAYDLSKRDIYGNPIKQETANCYVIKEPGLYKFPIAYGAAIKNGAVNNVAYTNETFPESFKNYRGNVITSPYVEEDTGNIAKQAYLTISDTDGIFSDIQIIQGTSCNYVQFMVNEVPDTGANGIISVQDENGLIMWNWHIWVWKDDLTLVSASDANVEPPIRREFLPVNLASKWDIDSSDQTKIKSWYYQWGRPTPMLCAAAYNSNENSESYGRLSYEFAEYTPENYSDYRPQDGIMNPTTFYYGSILYCSKASMFYNLWNQSNIDTGYSDNIILKTIYDPCPVGFVVPHRNDLRTHGSKFYYEPFFIPNNGKRMANTGLLDSVGNAMNVWSCDNITFYNSAIYTHDGRYGSTIAGDRSLGASIRPTVDPTFSGSSNNN